MSTAVKLERLEARIRPEDKRSLERAAELSGRKLTDFVVSAACEAARETIQRYEGMAKRSSLQCSRRQRPLRGSVRPPLATERPLTSTGKRTARSWLTHPQSPSDRHTTEGLLIAAMRHSIGS